MPGGVAGAQLQAAPYADLFMLLRQTTNGRFHFSNCILDHRKDFLKS
jgi:hypothetical protein